jgi:hypothetical protein
MAEFFQNHLTIGKQCDRMLTGPDEGAKAHRQGEGHLSVRLSLRGDVVLALVSAKKLFGMKTRYCHAGFFHFRPL